MNAACYTNGNYMVAIFPDGTKIRCIDDSLEWEPEFPETLDILISDYCKENCPYCYEGCSEQGKNADLCLPFIHTIRPYTEVAININCLNFQINELVPFLKRMHNQKVIVNITVNANEFINEYMTLRKFCKKEWIHGVGISIGKVGQDPSNDNHLTEEVLYDLEDFRNVVFHTIVGVTTGKQYQFIMEHKLPVLILGYKENLGRSGAYKDTHSLEFRQNIDWLMQNISKMMDTHNLVSFDNLALEQFHIKERLDMNFWNQVYMGEEGKYSFYIDAVHRQFAKNSMAPASKRYPLLDSVQDMYDAIRKKG